MFLEFHKYQGTGNDFIIIDNRNGKYNGLTQSQIQHLCDRRFGIGGDGLILLNKYVGYDFEMKYYNADGSESSMCGNGGRCLVKFAFHSGIIKNAYSFIAVDGAHEASIGNSGIVSLKMNDVHHIKSLHDYYVLNTGSPHFVQKTSNVEFLDVIQAGRNIRYNHEFAEEGINVNFVEELDEPDKIFVRTYERGVEDETFSCGTGVTAAALVSYHNDNGFNRVEVQTRGGWLSVEFDKIGNSYSNIWLSGPAEKVYEGKLEIADF